MLKTTVTIDSVKYNKDDFYILKAHDIDNNKIITIKGNIDEKPTGGTYYSLIASEEDNKTYGMQYKIILLSEDIDIGGSEDKTRGFLRLVLTEKQIDNFMKKFDNPIEIIKNKDIKSMCEVNGIKETLANSIVKKYEAKRDYVDCIEALTEYNISFSAIKKVMDAYKDSDRSIKTILENPYRLIVDVRGVGWEIADGIARKIGIDEFSSKRVEGYIYHLLSTSADDGNSWSETIDVFKDVKKLFLNQKPTKESKQKIKNLFTSAIRSLCENDSIWKSEDNKVLSTSRIRALEENIYKELIRLNSYENNKNKSKDFIEEKIKEIEKEQGFKLSEKQRCAVYLSNENNVMVLNGSAGTGKSSTAKAIISSMDLEFKLVALSGMASTRIGELTKLDGQTIHRFLEAGKGANGGFLYNKNNRIKANVVLDEAGMVSGDMFYSLLSSLDDGSRLFILGDTAQISAIGNCNVLADIIDSKNIPLVTLDKIFRQAQKSAIITESTSIVSGKKLFDNEYVGTMLLGELKDLFVDVYSDSSKTSNKMFSYYKSIYNKIKDVQKIQALLCIREKGASSCLNVNKKIQKWLKEECIIESNGYSVLEKYELHVGDKVLNTKNDYELTCVDGVTTAIFNGQQGIIREIDFENDMIYVYFFQNDKIIVFNKNNILNLELSYCVTNSKYQGSQCDYIITGFDYSAYKLLNREMLYTSITRAKKRCVVVCQNKAFNFAISNSDTKKRRTFLSEFLSNKKGG